MSWRQKHRSSSTWHDDSGEDTAPARWQPPSTKTHSSPATAEAALWNVVRRCGGPYKWLKSDLFMLGVASYPENLTVAEALSDFLGVLGRRLLPTAGITPLSSLDRARPEVQELSLLLAHLATLSGTGPTNTHKKLAQDDPWMTHGDPWQQSAQGGYYRDNATPQCVQYVTVEQIVEKTVEVPFAGLSVPKQAFTQTTLRCKPSGKPMETKMLVCSAIRWCGRWSVTERRSGSRHRFLIMTSFC